MHNQRQYLCEEMTFSALFNLSEPKRIVRSNTVKGPPLDIRAYDDAQFHMFNFKSNPSTTGLRHHGYIKFIRPKRDVPLSEVPCVVDCTCQDYRYRWSWVNKQRGASKVGPSSLNQAWNKAPKITNPGNKPGLCKHILALKDYITGLMWDLPKTGDRSSDDVLSKLTNYATKRWSELPQQMAAAKSRDARFAAAKSLTRAGRPQPDPSALPGIPGTEEPVIPERTSVPTSDAPEMPETVDDIEKIKPPTLTIKPERDESVESKNRGVVDTLCNMRPLTEELNILRSLIEDEEAQTPPTEGEAAHGNALDLLKSIDQGIRTLNTGLETLATSLQPEEPIEEPVNPEADVPPQTDETPGAPGAETDDVASLERDLKNLGVPKTQ